MALTGGDELGSGWRLLWYISGDSGKTLRLKWGSVVPRIQPVWEAEGKEVETSWACSSVGSVLAEET